MHDIGKVSLQTGDYGLDKISNELHKDYSKDLSSSALSEDLSTEARVYISGDNVRYIKKAYDNITHNQSDTPKNIAKPRSISVSSSIKTAISPLLEVKLKNLPLGIIQDIKTANNQDVRYVGCGSFGEVTYATIGETEKSIKYYARKNRKLLPIKKKISSPISTSVLLVKKTPKHKDGETDVSENVKYYEDAAKVIKEQEKNEIVGIESIAVFEKSKHSIVVPYQGIALTELCVASKDDVSLSVLNKLCIANQIIEKVKNLHQRGIAHKDIKPSNILINSQGIVSLIDFDGITVKAPEDYKVAHKLGVKTREYSPPEIINNNSYSTYDHKRIKTTTLAHDSWSLGVTLYELFSEMPSSSFFDIINRKKVFLNYQSVLGCLDMHIYPNSEIPQEIKDIISGFLKYDPASRLTPKEALTSDIFNNDIYNKSAFALHVEHDKYYKELASLEIKLSEAKKNNDLQEITQTKQQILTTKEQLKETQALIYTSDTL